MNQVPSAVPALLRTQTKGGVNPLATLALTGLILMAFVGWNTYNSNSANHTSSAAASLGSAFTQATHTPSHRPATNPVVTTPAAFIAFALPYARAAHLALGWPVSVILAQWMIETASRIPTQNGYNWANVKAMDDWPVTSSGFIYAASPATGLDVYIECGVLYFYHNVAVQAQQKGADAAAVALGQSPWDEQNYTSDGRPGDSLLRMMRQYNLVQFDS